MTAGGVPAPNIGDADYPGYAMGAAADALKVTPAFLRAVEAAGLFEAHRSDGGHRRYSLDDLHLADRARHLVDDGLRLDAAVRITRLEYQLAAAQKMIEVLRGGRTNPAAGPDRADASDVGGPAIRRPHPRYPAGHRGGGRLTDRGVRAGCA